MPIRQKKEEEGEQEEQEDKEEKKKEEKEEDEQEKESKKRVWESEKRNPIFFYFHLFMNIVAILENSLLCRAEGKRHVNIWMLPNFSAGKL